MTLLPDNVLQIRTRPARRTPHRPPHPGTDSALALAHDILAALNKPVPLNSHRPLDPAPAWTTAAAVLLREAAGLTGTPPPDDEAAHRSSGAYAGPWPARPRPGQPPPERSGPPARAR